VSLVAITTTAGGAGAVVSFQDAGAGAIFRVLLGWPNASDVAMGVTFGYGSSDVNVLPDATV